MAEKPPRELQEVYDALSNKWLTPDEIYAKLSNYPTETLKYALNTLVQNRLAEISRKKIK